MKHIITYDFREDKKEIIMKRTAIRAVIEKNNLILLIYLNKTCEYKFPGCGLEEGESYEDTLKREVLEEAGALVTHIEDCIGYIDQIYPDKYIKDEIFSMRSIYYKCKVIENVKALDLSFYEADLGFEPVWVSLDKAIKVNENRIKRGIKNHWTIRELFMLKHLKNGE